MQGNDKLQEDVDGITADVATPRKLCACMYQRHVEGYIYIAELL